MAVIFLSLVTCLALTVVLALADFKTFANPTEASGKLDEPAAHSQGPVVKGFAL